ncbi:hypothetical protein TWF730_004213 [Orbilia blumenaviensis]|uniref:Phosphoglycerate mutase n=1 Tax=Orbilia blumenaviensis TaxID=1796055 RepID=A0AAV9U273_9PEZI
MSTGTNTPIPTDEPPRPAKKPVMPYLVSDRRPMFEYSVVRSLFLQSLPEYLVDQREFNKNYFSKNFGLMLYTADDKPDWKALVDTVNDLNDRAPPDERYKVFYLARHGQGPHNEAIELYTQAAWEAHIGMLKEYKGLTLGPDPDLTEKGKAEAQSIGHIWKTQLQHHSLHSAGALPQKFYASPFTRALRTLELTWSDIVLDLPNPPRVQIRENLRETIGHHWCDMRGKMSDIKQRFPFVDVEEGMDDDDTIWTDVREDEVGGSMDCRLREVIDDIFAGDGETFISITAHSGCLRCVLRVVGHRIFSLETSRMIPVVVKAKLLPEFKDKIKLPERVTGLPYEFVPKNWESLKRKEFDFGFDTNGTVTPATPATPAALNLNLAAAAAAAAVNGASAAKKVHLDREEDEEMTHH